MHLQGAFLFSQGIFFLIALRTQGAASEFQQIWADEFTPCDGSDCVNGLSTFSWGLEQGDGSKYGPHLTGWGNNEVQCYTSNQRNVRVVRRAGGARGVLVIEAHFHEKGTECSNPGAPNSTRWWTSARLTSRELAAFGFESQPIKLEASVKVPNALGAWAAFWLLPNTPRDDCLACGDFGDGWCSSGEVNVLETRNRDRMFQSTVHYGGLSDASWQDCRQSTDVFNAANATPYWNRVSVVMGPSNISFYVNDTLTHSVDQSEWYTPGADKETNPVAPFNRPFYMLLNLAVGGNYVTSQTGGSLITDTRKAPYSFMVDWVRVYRQAPSRRSMLGRIQ